MSSSWLLPSARPRRKIDMEARIVRRREKENESRAGWDTQDQYYKTCDSQNSRFEEWTSPRYYETNNRLVRTLRDDSIKETNLAKRRERLQKLFEHEERAYAVEMTLVNREKMRSARSTVDSALSTELLHEVYRGVRDDDARRQRHTAELKLYQRWRAANPIVRDYERAQSARALKMSWLDRQVEKRVEMERAEEEARVQLAERDRRVAQELREAEETTRRAQEKNKQHQADLVKQMAELEEMRARTARLRSEEERQRACLAQLATIEREAEEAERERGARSLALANLHQHTRRLKQRGQDIRENLERERALMEKLMQMELDDVKADAARKQDLRTAGEQFIAYTRAQQALERRRQQCLEFVFESEAKSVLAEQERVWHKEEESRKVLVADVLQTVRKQIEENVHRVRERQIDVLREREAMVATIERAKEEERACEEEERRRREELKVHLDKQVHEHALHRKQLTLLEQKRIEDELDEALKEEERLRREMMEMQRRAVPTRRTRTQILF